MIDACALFPTVTREILLGAARQGIFQPLWSQRILDEWRYAAARIGAVGETVAQGEIALARAAFPAALVALPAPDRGLWLPDQDDIHVLQAAISGQARGIITLNLKDFPRRILAEHGLLALHPDAFLSQQFAQAPETIGPVVASVRAEAERLSGQPWPTRKLLRKARLPRLGAALERSGM